MDALAELLSSRVKAEILRLLFGLGRRELHVRELARQAGLNDATVRQELKRLGGLGLIAARRDGNRTYYGARTDHPLYGELHNLVLKTSGLADVLREALILPGIRAAFVFGSLASGKERPGSDVDLMVVGKPGLRQLAAALAGVPERLGREINPHALSAEEFARRKKAKDHFLTQVLDAPKLFVVGDPHELERMGG
ncbi:MAG: nucleotidyltransferase domain-containing protein [Planctomycetota bacterium]|nr:nucleotidyltransferase domain-containing protein [Planctomycetota bacterium]